MEAAAFRAVRDHSHDAFEFVVWLIEGIVRFRATPESPLAVLQDVAQLAHTYSNSIRFGLAAGVTRIDLQK